MSRRRPDARGYIEQRGSTWFLRRRVAMPDPATGEISVRPLRIPLGQKSELRTRAQARVAADEYLAMLQPELLAPGRPLLAVQYLERFLAVHVPLMRPTSRLKYRTVIRTYLVPELAGDRLVDVDTACLRQVVASLSARLARSTVASVRGILLQILRQAKRDGFAARIIDPRDVRLPKTELERERRNIRTDELEQILAASEFPRRALWAVMGYAGLRIGEALGLTVADVDLQARLLHVRRAAIAGELAPLKTKTSRAAVPMIPQLENLLREYMSTGVYTGEVSQLLFSTRRGTPLAADYVRRHWLQPLLNSLCLPKAGCHAFRHGLPQRLAAAGVSPNVIRQVMRHANLAMTEAYLHTTAADVRRALDDSQLGAQA